MAMYKYEISNLRKDFENNIGKKIIVTEASGKRSKPQEKVAIIENTYPKYVSLKFEKANGLSSYNYTDWVTEKIEVKFCDGEPFSPSLQKYLEEKRHKSQKNLVENS